MTITEGLLLNDDFREPLQAVGTVFEGEHGGVFAIVPSAMFDESELPSVDLEPVTVETDDGPTLAVPRYRPACLRGGVHIVAREHIAAAWYEMSRDLLEWEYIHRAETGLPVPRYLESKAGDSIGDEVDGVGGESA